MPASDPQDSRTCLTHPTPTSPSHLSKHATTQLQKARREADGSAADRRTSKTCKHTTNRSPISLHTISPVTFPCAQNSNSTRHARPFLSPAKSMPPCQAC